MTVSAGSGVLANDSDPDGDALTAALVSAPAHGTLSLGPSGAFVYTPAATFVGTDTFSYNAVDTFGNVDLATVTIRVGTGGYNRDQNGDQHYHGDGCDHELGINGHYAGDGCEHDRLG